MFRKESTIGKILAAIVTCSFLFMIAAGNFCIYTDVFTYDGDRREAFLLFAEVGLLLFFIYRLIPEVQAILEKSRSKDKKKDKKRGRVKGRAFLGHFAAAGGFLTGYIMLQEKIWTGFLLIANELAEKWSVYYDVHIGTIEVVKKTEEGNTWAVLFLLLVFFWWTAVSIVRWKKITAAAVPTFFLICLELLVGYSPKLPGMLLGMTGFVGLLPYCRTNRGKKKEKYQQGITSDWVWSGILTSGGLCICFAAAAIVGNDPAGQLAAKQDQMLSFQWALEDHMKEWDIFYLFPAEAGRVSNRRPRYKERDVIRITASAMPDNSLYLRGYTGDAYQEGRWKNESREDFPDIVSAWQKPNAGLSILNMAYQSQGSRWDLEGMQYELEYLYTGDDYAYVPYFTNLSGVNGKPGTAGAIAIEADTSVLRNRNKKLVIEGIITNDGLENMKGTFLPQDYREVGALYERDYLRRYLEVPKGLPRMEALGKQLQAVMDEKYGRVLKKLDLVRQDTGSAGAICKEVIAAYLVRNAIFERTEYQLDLAPVPFGSDVTEHFLFDSGEGFCQHYASAGVLLLRELGIPARYVTGYMLPESAFLENPPNEDGYTMLVKDSNAHAWVEIYKSGTGWIPIEMTKGVDSLWNTLEIYIAEDGSNVGLYYDSGSDNMRGMAMDLRQYSLEDEAEDEDKISEQEVKNKSSLTMGANEFNRLTQEEGNSEQEKNEGNPSEEENKGNIRENKGVVPVIFIAVFIFSAIVIVYFYSERLYRIRLKKYLQPGKADYRRAVRGISEAVYRLLKKRGIIRRKKMDDSFVKQTMKEAYPLIPEEELERYFEIAERAAFAEDAIGREEAVFCYELYLKLQLLKLK